MARAAASTSEGRVGRLIRPAAGVRAANGAVRRALTPSRRDGVDFKQDLKHTRIY